MAYRLRIVTDLSPKEAETSIRAALAAEGFGVLTEIDVAATLHEKLGVERGPYRILGACNPGLADQALRREPDIGVLLPCNVVVYEEDDRTVVAAFDPAIMSDVTGNQRLQDLAEDARTRLERALSTLS
ncbi:MAG TPA: DUF302 domain-containing protein [Acidimicrobiia bacterium]|nr:DUF302 domain-containing protein [Acidimicrobiia bacterium]